MGTRRDQSSSSSGGGKNNGKGTVHPVWRGVGILLMVLMPVMGYVGSLLLLDENNKHSWVRIPNELLVPGPDHLLLVKAIMTVVIGASIYFIFMMLTFIIFRIVAPPKLGPTDVPPVQWKSKDRS
jgi:quinol-cytochrome oxidoreductase complex cytochrome b subunit